MQRRAPVGGGKLIVLACENPKCTWGETQERFIVQVRPDGTIPDPETNPQRVFPHTEIGKRMRDDVDEFEHIRQALRAQNEQTKRPEGGETGR